MTKLHVLWMKIGIRTMMIGGVVIGIMGVLYSPLFIAYFYTKKTVTILTWPHMLDRSALSAFEQQYGCTVNIRYCESNDELLAKLEGSGGEGYDLVMPSDFMVPSLRSAGLIKPFQKERFTFLHDIYPTLTGHYYDPENRYTVPFYWGVYGVGVNHAVVATIAECTWNMLFNPPAGIHVGMVDDVRLMSNIAAFYLFGANNAPRTDRDVDAVIAVLRAQKKSVYAYTDMRGEYLLATQAAPLVLLISSDAARIMPSHPEVTFCIPREGSFMIIDSFAWCTSSTNDDLVHAFLNYVYKTDILAHYVERFGFFSPAQSVSIPVADQLKPFAVPTKELCAQLIFFENRFTREQLNRVWIALKA